MGHETVVKANGRLLIAGRVPGGGGGRAFRSIKTANQTVGGQVALGPGEDTKEAVSAAREARKLATEWGFPGGREAGGGENPP